MTKRTVLTCKVIDSKNWDDNSPGKTFEIINPFGRHGRRGGNDPAGVMVMRWLHSSGATYVFNHTNSNTHPKEKPENTIKVSASCGQEVSLDLKGIDPNQEIREVTIRGVKYIPE